MTVALIVAAGSGERLGAAQPKALVELAGRPLYEWSLRALREVPGVDRIAVAVPAHDGCGAAELAVEASSAPEVVAVAGGRTRSESVMRALHAVGPGDPVLVHDAARPLVTAELAETVIAALRGDPAADAAIAATPVTDTIKRVDAAGAVTETLRRSELWSVQTPQVFRRAALARALQVSDAELALATDDAWLVERQGGKVIVVRSPADNLKVTVPVDLRMAELLLAERRASPGAPEHA